MTRPGDESPLGIICGVESNFGRNMKVHRVALLTSALLLTGFFATSVHADVLSIPAAGGMIGGGPGQSCVATDATNYDWSIYADPNQAGNCDFEIPIMIPIGHTINQVTILYGTDNQVADPAISASLATKSTVAPFPANSEFEFASLAYVPEGTIASHNLMAQAGKNFPDAFVVQSSTQYRVKFITRNGVAIWGLSVNYN
jgi:hypothetical protein